MTRLASRTFALLALGLALSGGAGAAGCVPPKSYGGGVTGTVVDGTDQPALASVYLVPKYDDEVPNEPTVPASSPPVEESARYTSNAGRFRIDAAAGEYVLVATNQVEAAYVDVTIADGTVLDLGTVRMEPCNDPTTTMPVPCPSYDMDSGSAPPASFTIDRYVPDYVDVQRHVYPDYEELYVRTESYASGVAIEILFPDPASNGYGTGSYALVSTGSNPVWATLSYYDGSTGAYGFYAAGAGTLTVDAFSTEQGGAFSGTLSDVRFDWVQPTSGQLDSQTSITVVASDPLEGTVVVIQQAAP